MMKAAVVHALNDIKCEDVPEQVVGPGDVKIMVKYCGICGSDMPRVLNGTCHSFPQILGHEFSGIVAEIGSDVTSVSVGDNVVGIPLVPCMKCQDCERGDFSLCRHYSFIGSRQPGGMAECVVVPEQNAFKIDPSIPLEKAVFFEPSTVALHGVLLNGFTPKPEDRVVVFGAGTIGILLVQWCHIFGAREIVVVGRSRERLAVALKYGASKVYSTLDDGWQDAAIAATDGNGYEYVFDAAGSDMSLKGGFYLAGNKSRYCMVGTPTKPMQFSVKEWEIINRKEMLVTGSWMSYSKPWPGVEWKKTAECMASGELVIGDDMVCRHFPLEEVSSAFKAIEVNRAAIKGRVIIDM